MLKIRFGTFETNSSSCDVLILPKELYTVPKSININTDDYRGDDNYEIDGCSYGYYLSNSKKEFLGYLKHCGVKEIYIDNTKIDMSDVEENDILPELITYGYEPLIKDKNTVNRILFGKVQKLIKSHDGDLEDEHQNELVARYEKDTDRYDIIYLN